MGTKRVLQRNCDRCARIWYEDEDAASKENSVIATGVFDGVDLDVRFAQLCAGCAHTVRSALEAMNRVIAKASPVRGAKKRAEDVSAVPTSSLSTTLVAPAVPSAPAVFVAPSVRT
jgi:hypothetical protein